MNTVLKSKFDTLQHDLRHLISLLDHLDEESLHRKPEGAWSAVQIMYHLVLSEEGTVSYLSKKLQSPPEEVEKAGLSARLRAFALSRALRNMNKKYKAPAKVGEVPEKPDYQATKIRYTELRKDLGELLGKFDKERMKRSYFKHPVAGKINISQTLDFIHDHFQRHRAQMLERSGIGAI